jgi:hypothetical protein
MKNKVCIYNLENHSKNHMKDIIVSSYNYYNCFEFKYNRYLVSTNYGMEIMNDLISLIEPPKHKLIMMEIYKGGLMINKNDAVLTSNQTIKNGKDEIIFFDDRNNKFKERIEGYSFVDSSNGLYLISIEEKDISIILCACKKYLYSQKNGILLIDNNNVGENNYYQFYDTNNYEVYCFCQIIYKENIYILDDEKNKRYYTDYIFVGGFDKDNQKGVLKLYKLENNEKDIKIKYISDIEIDNIEFKSPISSIVQYKCSNDLLIVCLDGNVSLFNFDIQLFLSKEQEEVKEIQI